MFVVLSIPMYKATNLNDYLHNLYRMPKTHTCRRCGYNTHQKTSIRQHYQRKTVCTPVFEDVPVATLLDQLDNTDQNDHSVVAPVLSYMCPLCSNRFVSKPLFAAHMPACLQHYHDETPHIHIDEHRNTTNITNNVNININVQSPRPFGEEDVSHVSDDYIKQCMFALNSGFKDLITTIHFNPHVPENHNIRYKSTKQKSCMVYMDGRWIETDQNSTVDKLIMKGQRMMNHVCIKDASIMGRMGALMDWFRRTSPNMTNKGSDYYDLRNKLLLLIKDGTCYLTSQAETDDEMLTSGT